MIRLLYAHPITVDPDDARDHAREIQAHLSALWDTTVSVTTGHDHFYTLEFGWDDWVPSVVERVDWDGEPLFHAIIVPLPDGAATVIGRGAGGLVEACLEADKAVYAWLPAESCAVEVTDVRRTESNSMKQYATLILAEG